MFKCECLNCGNVVETERHCMDIFCTKCGGEMRRVNRPGIGAPGLGRGRGIGRRRGGLGRRLGRR